MIKFILMLRYLNIYCILAAEIEIVLRSVPMKNPKVGTLGALDHLQGIGQGEDRALGLTLKVAREGNHLLTVHQDLMPGTILEGPDLALKDIHAKGHHLAQVLDLFQKIEHKGNAS